MLEVRRIEKLPLQLAADLVHGARADDITAGERMRNGLQKRIAQLERQRLRSGHDGVQCGRRFGATPRRAVLRRRLSPSAICRHKHPRTEVAVIRHFKERMPYGLFVPDVNVEYPPTMRAPAAFGVWGEFFMDKLFEALMPRLPPWLIPPGAIVVLLILAWPVLSEIWIVVIPSYRRYAREKRRLELLKLYYEIEAIKKTNQLSELPLVSADNLTQSARTTRNVVDEITRPQEKQVAAISNAQKFIFGCFGGAVILPISAAVALATATPQQAVVLMDVLNMSDVKLLVSLITSILFGAVLGGVIARITNPKTRGGAFVRGLLVSLLAVLVFSWAGYLAG